MQQFVDKWIPDTQDIINNYVLQYGPLRLAFPGRAAILCKLLELDLLSICYLRKAWFRQNWLLHTIY